MSSNDYILTIFGIPFNIDAHVGLGPVAVRHYVDDWIKRITDVTPLAHQIQSLVAQNKLAEAQRALPEESFYLRP